MSTGRIPVFVSLRINLRKAETTSLKLLNGVFRPFVADVYCEIFGEMNNVFTFAMTSIKIDFSGVKRRHQLFLILLPKNLHHCRITLAVAYIYSQMPRYLHCMNFLYHVFVEHGAASVLDGVAFNLDGCFSEGNSVSMYLVWFVFVVA
jgi:hypothetical protein